MKTAIIIFISAIVNMIGFMSILMGVKYINSPIVILFLFLSQLIALPAFFYWADYLKKVLDK